MQTALTDTLKTSADGPEADAILRSCVHCGFCSATCPTYQLTGNELDGPRGRIYLIKSVLEGEVATQATQHHLDRCLTCRACETACPSGVQYGRLLEIGRTTLESRKIRSVAQRVVRWLLRQLVPYPQRFGLLLRIADVARGVLPVSLSARVPDMSMQNDVGEMDAWPPARHQRRMLVLAGCAQSALAPGINRACARVLDGLGISLLEAREAGCCGALSQHLSAIVEAQNFVRANIDAWWPYVEDGIEAIVVTASGCMTTVKEYGYLLRDDPDYAEKAKRIADLCRDPVEVLAGEDLTSLALQPCVERIAFQAPCSLQHGLSLSGNVESLLRGCGFDLAAVGDPQMCCGSAGTYSILQSGLAMQLRSLKLEALKADAPSLIASANIGCLTYLREGTDIPVVHWIELIDHALKLGQLGVQPRHLSRTP